MFEHGMNGKLGKYWGGCFFKCHTTGYNKNAIDMKGGFDNAASTLTFVEPE